MPPVSVMRRTDPPAALADVVDPVLLRLRPVPVINPAKRWVIVLLSICLAVGFLTMVLVIVQTLPDRPRICIKLALPFGIFLMGVTLFDWSCSASILCSVIRLTTCRPDGAKMARVDP